MINFEEELNAILKDDPLDILKAKPKVSSVMSADNRLKASFEEINHFVSDTGHEPQKSRDMNERKLFSRLQGLRDNPEKAAMLLALDKHDLLKDVKIPEAAIIESVDDIFDADPLGLLADVDNQNDGEADIFDLSNLPSKRRASTDFMSKRKPCKDFEHYQEQLATVQKEIKESKRKLIGFTDKGEALVAGHYYILGGILLFLESTEMTSDEKTIGGKRFRKDGRTRCIFENATESNMKYRSLAKALYKDGKIVTQTEEEINSNCLKNVAQVEEKDQSSGFIYVLSSLSKKPEIQQFENLYKIGFSTDSVEKRVRNAENEPTYLMGAVHTVAEYEAYNMDTHKFENLLHHFLADVCLDLDVADNKGRMHKPREWFIAPLNVIDQVIRLIIDGQIQNYRYDSERKEVVFA